MNRKGFTLVEILAVIVILGLIAVIITPIVSNLLKDSEESLYNKQIDSIEKATKKYMVENSQFLPDSGSVISVSISKLIDEGAIDANNVINPKTKEQMNGCVVVSYNNEFNQYEYNYEENCSVTNP